MQVKGQRSSSAVLNIHFSILYISVEHIFLSMPFRLRSNVIFKVKGPSLVVSNTALLNAKVFIIQALYICGTCIFINAFWPKVKCNFQGQGSFSGSSKHSTAKG